MARPRRSAAALDYLVVGSGLTGATLARLLHDAGRRVLVVDRRSHLGGNVHDHIHPSGISIHTYGPHYFRTSSDRIWSFVRRFADFHPYVATVQSRVGDEHVPWPLGASYIAGVVGPGWVPEFTGTPSNFEEAALALMPRLVYEKFVKEYNEKQWGVPARSLSAELCKRFDVRVDDDPRFTPHARYQGIPVDGYAAMMRRMLTGIPLHLGVDFLQRRADLPSARTLVFTGPIDEFFAFDLGRLAYRGQRREHLYFPDVDLMLPCAQVNNPTHAGGPFLRTLEWKQMMSAEAAARVHGTVITRETPHTPSDPSEYEYPFPDAANAELYARYQSRSRHFRDVLICGRLGEYRYFDMDQAIGRAQMIAERLLEGRPLAEILGSRSVTEEGPSPPLRARVV